MKGGQNREMTEQAKFDQLEDFGFGPNVMKQAKVCQACGQLVRGSASYCPDCGEKLSGESLFDRYKRRHRCCPGCDTVVSPDAQFCPCCGSQLHFANECTTDKDG